MPTRITFQGKRHAVANESWLIRHGKRYHIKDTTNHHLVGLTPEGKKESFEVGKSMKKDLKLKTYYSPAKRTRQTAFQIHVGHKSVGGRVAQIKRAKATGVRKELIGKGIFVDGKYADGEYAKVNKSTAVMVRKWLNGELDPKKILPPEVVTKGIDRRLALGRRAANRGITGYRILNVTHDWQILAKLEDLLGVKFETHGFQTPSTTTGIIIYHTKSGKDILECQGKRFDITKALKERS